MSKVHHIEQDNEPRWSPERCREAHRPMKYMLGIMLVLMGLSVSIVGMGMGHMLTATREMEQGVTKDAVHEQRLDSLERQFGKIDSKLEKMTEDLGDIKGQLRAMPKNHTVGKE